MADNLLKGNHTKPDYRGVPTVVFTIPPLAAVGLHEVAAREQGLRFRTNYANTSGWYSSRRVPEKYSRYEVLIEEGTDRIVGAHLFGSSSEELINVFALAIRSGILATALKKTIFSYPTHGSYLTYMVE